MDQNKQNNCPICKKPQKEFHRVALNEQGKEYFTNVFLYFCTNPKCHLSVDVMKIKNWKEV